MSAREIFIQIIARHRSSNHHGSCSVSERSGAKVSLLHPASRFLLMFVALMGLQALIFRALSILLARIMVSTSCFAGCEPHLSR